MKARFQLWSDLKLAIFLWLQFYEKKKDIYLENHQTHILPNFL